MPNDSEHQRAYKERQRKRGLALIAVWVPEVDRAKLHSYAKRLRKAAKLE